MIIGITGYAGVGKDTLADLLKPYKFHKRSFADKVREAYYEVAPDSHREAIEMYGWDLAKRGNIHIRIGLQGVGAMCRKVFGKTFWIDQAMPTADELLDLNIVYADVRYPNEAEAIWDKGGYVIRLKRDAIQPVNGHESEILLDTIEADLVIENKTPEEELDILLKFVNINKH